MTARLIVMDIDSTLINQEVIDLLGEEAGVGKQVAQITERAMRGELDYKQELEERVRKLEAENAYLKKLAALGAEKRLRAGRGPR